jgi:hypothetical protein
MADTKERKLPPPAVSQETQAYWDAAAKGKLLVRKCTACGQLGSRHGSATLILERS